MLTILKLHGLSCHICANYLTKCNCFVPVELRLLESFAKITSVTERCDWW